MSANMHGRGQNLGILVGLVLGFFEKIWLRG